MSAGGRLAEALSRKASGLLRDEQPDGLFAVWAPEQDLGSFLLGLNDVTGNLDCPTDSFGSGWCLERLLDEVDLAIKC